MRTTLLCSMLAYFIALSLATTNTARAQVNETDSLALIDFMNATNIQAIDGDWGIGPISSWMAVTVENGRVVELVLKARDLTGTLPESLGNLTNLRRIELPGNQLTGPIPASLGNLTNLEHLVLGGRLGLSGNQLSGPIPPSLGQLTSLISLILTENKLTGSIPDSLGDLASLTMLSLRGNELGGSIPESLGNLAILERLDLAYNQLSRTIPASLGDLEHLEFLNLSGNALTSFAERDYDKWTNLKFLWVTANELTALPDLKKLTSLEYLEIGNNQLTTVPDISGLTSLIWLRMPSNNVTDLPDLSGLPLSTLHVSYNALTFDDLEPLAAKSINDFLYQYQRGLELRVTKENGNTVLWMDAGGTATTYEWARFDEDSNTFKPIDDAMSASYTVTESGRYYGVAKNTQLPDLTLTSLAIDVEVEGCPVGKAGVECEGIVVNSVRDADRGTGDDGNLLPGCDTGEMIDRNGQEEPECTLRAAIQFVNAGTGKATAEPIFIDFSIPGDGTPVIQLQEVLPEIEQPVLLDPFAQRLSTGEGVVLDGTEAGEGAHGLVIKAGGSGSTVEGLSIRGFEGTAIRVLGASNNIIEENRIVGNRVGVDIGGNSMVGESNLNKIQNNVIGDNEAGVVLGGDAHENMIENNFIGTDRDGVTPLGNRGSGVFIIVGPDRNTIRNNVISDNQGWGILGGSSGFIIGSAVTSGNIIEANKIGTDQTGTKALPNGKDEAAASISLSGLRKTEVRDNVIAGNNGTGLRLFNTIDSIVEGNYIGTNEEGVSNLGNGQHGIYDTSGSNTRIEGNIIVANGTGQTGFHGIYLNYGVGAQVVNNAIGVYVASLLDTPVPMGNSGCGVQIDKANGARIEENIITANGESGVCVFAIRGTIDIWYNLIGLRETTQGPVGNQEHGVSLIGVSEGLLLQNSIVFNGQDGVSLFDDDEVAMLFNVIAENNQAGARATRVAEMILEANEILNNRGEGTGIHFTASHGLITGNTITDDAGDAITLEDGSTATVTGNNIFDNAGMGLNNLTPSVMVTAPDNWWGDASGPGGEGPGSGDAVSAGIDVSGWLDDMVAVVVSAERDEIVLPLGEADTVSVFVQNWQVRDDALDLTISDTEGWLQSPAALTIAIEDSTGAETRLAVAVPAGTPNGTTSTVEVTATSQADDSHTAATTFTLIAESAALAQVVVLPGTVNLAPGDTVQFDALGLDQFSRTVEITPMWTATGGVIDADGVYIAGEAMGEFTVTATDPATGLSGTAQIGNGVSVAVEEAGEAPDAFYLAPNYPNPFNPETTIAFTLPQQARVRLAVYDVLGREVAVLVDDALPAGAHRARFDAGRLASGVYVYRLTADRFSQTRTMVLLR